MPLFSKSTKEDTIPGLYTKIMQRILDEFKMQYIAPRKISLYGITIQAVKPIREAKDVFIGAIDFLNIRSLHEMENSREGKTNENRHYHGRHFHHNL